MEHCTFFIIWCNIEWFYTIKIIGRVYIREYENSSMHKNTWKSMYIAIGKVVVVIRTSYFHFYCVLSEWSCTQVPLTKTVQNYICKHQLNDKQFTKPIFFWPTFNCVFLAEKWNRRHTPIKQLTLFSHMMTNFDWNWREQSNKWKWMKTKTDGSSYFVKLHYVSVSPRSQWLFQIQMHRFFVKRQTTKIYEAISVKFSNKIQQRVVEMFTNRI